LVIDVRSTDAYRAGHIPGALHVPLDQVASRADEIRALAKPPHQIVAYCSCPEEHASLAAVSILAEHGMPNASALVGGFGEWVRRGGRVERSTFLVPRSSFPFPFSFSLSFPFSFPFSFSFWNRPGDERLAEQRDIARIRSEQPEEHADGGALTRAVRSTRRPMPPAATAGRFAGQECKRRSGRACRRSRPRPRARRDPMDGPRRGVPAPSA